MLKNIVKGTERIPLIVLLSAVHGFGKSSWAASAKECGLAPLFVPTENVSQIDCDKFPVCKTLADFRAHLREVYEEEHDYKTLVIDTVDFLEGLIWEHICETRSDDPSRPYKSISDFPYGRGYAAADDVFGGILRALIKIRDEKHMMIVMLAHAGSRTVNEPGLDPYDCYAPKLHVNSKGAGIGATIQEACDVVLFGNQQTFVRKQKGAGEQAHAIMNGLGPRTLFTESGPGWTAKNRYSLPPTIPLGDDDGNSHFSYFWNEILNSKVWKGE